MSSKQADLPFYNGRPVALSLRQWLAVLLYCLAGFIILSLPLPLFMTRYGQFIPACLFLFLPLYGLHRVAPGYLGELFRPPGWRALWQMPGFALLNLFVSLIVALVVASFFMVSINPAAEILAEFSLTDQLIFLLRTLPQLIGEELITILPLLALMAYFVSHRGWSRRCGLLMAWLLTALLFGLLHLPTYSWNLAQSMLVIGAARMVLTGAYIYTGSVWVSAGAHIITDWFIFAIVMSLPELQDLAEPTVFMWLN